MSPSTLWLLFASLTVVGSAAYNIGMKVGPQGVNPLGFVFIAHIVIVILTGLCCLVSEYAFKSSVLSGVTSHTVKYAALCGVAAATIDVCYLLALRFGPMISTQVIWTVGGMVVVSALAVLFFGEGISATKALGIAFGIVSVFLITKAS